ncbi:MAG: LTA synthase family protein [Oscillospiraceae bacterium]|nr:LTA synthase family protein [Oscillospiraceae bacterium]
MPKSFVKLAFIVGIVYYLIVVKRINIELEKSKISPWVFGFVLLFSVVSSLMFWFRKMMQGATFESAMFTVRSGVSGITSGMTMDAVRDILLISLICMGFALTIIYLISKIKINGHRLGRTHLQIMIVIMLFLSIFLQDSVYYISSYRTYAKLANEPSNFIAENYVNPKDANITFPDKKRNLIYIVLESMENTFADNKSGGISNTNLIPNLTNLANKNVNFSNNDKLGGSLFRIGEAEMPGVWWTTASLVSQTAGLPLKQFDSMKEYKDRTPTILSGAWTLTDILAENGYNQVFMCGSYAGFGGRDKYFRQHGNVEIKDLVTAEADGIIPEGYNNDFWGMEDSKLFEYAKKELKRLAEADGTFALTLLTVDTHFPDGWVDEGSNARFKTKYENAIYNSDRLVGEFVRWLGAQGFYKNTTIVLVGDHPSMSEFANHKGEKNPEHIRATYNCLINSVAKPANSKYRMFSNLDMFPTILSAIGAAYDGNGLGLGIDLFSNEHTLIEQFGFEYVANELHKASKFYDKLK